MIEYVIAHYERAAKRMIFVAAVIAVVAFAVFVLCGCAHNEQGQGFPPRPLSELSKMAWVQSGVQCAPGPEVVE